MPARVQQRLCVPVLEWQVRIDRGMWQTFVQERSLLLRDPLFLLQGEHLVEVRARLVGKAGTLDPTPVEIPVLIDTVEPKLSLRHADAGVEEEAEPAPVGGAR